MNKYLLLGAFALCASTAQAAEVKPFVMIDSSSERDSLSSEYINANVTVGVKTADKIEYSLKLGGSQKEKSGTETYSRNIEGKVKKSFDIGMAFSPYVSLRLGQKTDNKDSTSFSHWAVDAGLKLPLTEAFALDAGVRYRDALNSSTKYQSTRFHLMGLYEIDPYNVVGLRYATSNSNNKPEEERDGWRIHYQRNY